MNESMTLARQFLIAMPTLADPNFNRTVTLVCQHSDDGALGIVINRRTNLVLRDVLEQMEIPVGGLATPDAPVYFGGPVQTERGFILHENSGEWASTLPISDELALSTSRDVLEAIAENRGPRHCLLALGYAGWASGQLEHEIGENAWLSGPAHHDIIFSVPVEERWPLAVQRMGIDPGTLSGEAGHA